MELQGETTEPLGHEVWAILAPEEAEELFDALRRWIADDAKDPEWHFHLGEGDAQLTVAIKPAPTT